MVITAPVCWGDGAWRRGGGLKGGRGVDEDVQSVPLEPMLSDI